MWKLFWGINMGNVFRGNSYGIFFFENMHIGNFFSSLFDWCAVSIENVLENEHLKFEKCIFCDFWSTWVHFFKFFWLSCGFNRKRFGKCASKIWKVQFWLKMTYFDQKWSKIDNFFESGPQMVPRGPQNR